MERAPWGRQRTYAVLAVHSLKTVLTPGSSHSMMLGVEQAEAHTRLSLGFPPAACFAVLGTNSAITSHSWFLCLPKKLKVRFVASVL